MTTEMFDLSAFLPYRLAVLSERISRRLAAEYDRISGIGVAEWRVLVHLLRCGKVSVRDIHDCVNLEKPRVSRAVTRLEGMGLVRKVPAAGDGRLVAISLTEDGHAALARILPAVQGIEGRLTAGVTDRDMAVFLDVMERMHRVLDADPEARRRSRLDLDGNAAAGDRRPDESA